MDAPAPRLLTVEETLARHGGGHGYVFAYGSLMWRPDFPHADVQPARMAGVHRAPCVLSHVHRGTPERPGIVFGLDRGGSCNGLAYEVAGDDMGEVLSRLRARELVTHVYRERLRPMRLADGRAVEGVVYLVDRTHPQYAGRLCLDALLARIRGSVGRSGPNEEYVTQTARRMARLGIRDRLIEDLARALEDQSQMSPITEAGPAGPSSRRWT